MSTEISAIPPVPSGLREAAQRGTLIPFVGAGASRLGGCPGWSEFADGAPQCFVDQGKFTYSQVDQIRHLSPCLKLSLACALEEEHKIAIDFRKLLHPRDRGEEPKGRRRYASLSKLGKTFVTTNYDGWLDEELPEPVLSLSGGGDVATAAVPRVFEGPRCTGSSRGSLFVAALGGDAQALEATRVPSKQPPSRGASTDSEQSGRRVLGNCRG